MSNGQQKLLCDVATGVPRPLVSAAMRREVFDLVHGLSHPGTTATVKIMKNKFVWHGIAKDVRAWARACIGCQMAKIHRHNRAPLTKFERATARFAHVHVDLVGPLPASKGYTHLLTVIDRFTRWPEAIPLAQTDTASIGRAFALHWVARFRHTFGYHIRPRSSVHVRHVESSRRIAGIQNPPYHGLPSTVERPGRKIPQVVKSSIESQVNDAVMVGRATLGHAGTEDHAEGGFGHVGCRDGLWINVDGTRKPLWGLAAIRDAAEHLQNMRKHGRTTCASTGCMAWHEGHSHYKRFRRSRVRLRETRC